MTKEYPLHLHAIWNTTLADPSVTPYTLIMEAMQRAYDAGHAEGGKYGWQPDTGSAIAAVTK